MQADPASQDRFRKSLDGFLERNQDRALFDLPPRQDINQSAMNTKLRSLARPNWLASAWPR